MPNGTITSTENTFGTVNGALSGTIAGTLTGSVGVPGPAGSQGPAGPVGPPGPPGVGGTWGSITGTLSSQTDLQTVLDGKYSTTNPSGFITSSALAPYLTSSTASATYQTLAGMSAYLTTSAAAAGYYPLSGNPSGFLTSASLAGYATQTFVTSQGYITASALTPYLTSATAATTYQTISGMSSYSTTAAANLLYAATARGLPASGTIGQVLTKQSGTDYDVAFTTLIPGDRYLTTSTTSNTIGNGTKTFTVGTGLSYSPQQDVVISFDASNHMHALVTSYNSGTGVLVVDVQHHTGSGTYSVWTINVGGTTPQASIVWGDITGILGNQTDLSTALNAKLDSSTAASTYAPIASPTFTGTVTIPSGASISGFAPLASPSLTGNVSIVSNSTGAALFIEQAGTGNILTLHDQASDTNFVAIDQNGKVSTIASDATVGAGFNIAHGVAPTTPVNGDIWTTTSGLFMRQNGTTRQYVDLDQSQTINGNKTFSNATQTLGNSTAASTINIGTGATLTATTKAINIGTNGVSGSTTNITLGSSVAGSGVNVTVNGSLTTTGATHNIANSTAASTLNLGAGATISGSTKAVNIGTAGVAGSTTNIAIGSTTGTSTTTLQGSTVGVTLAADNNTTGLATTAYVVGQAGSATPLVDGTAAVGTSLRYARQDHVHPTDTSRAALASPTFTGTPAAPTAAVDTNTTQIATTAFVLAQAAAATPLVDGTAAVGTSTRYARADHVHPTDTTRAPLASPSFTGTPSLPTGTTAVTQTAGNNTTAVATTAFVTAAVPAFGATADVNEPLSTTKAASIDNVREMLMSPAHQIFYQGAGVNGTSGAGAATNANSGRWKEYVSPNATVAGYAIGVFDTTAASIGFAGYTRGQNLTTRNWSKKVWLSGRCMIGHFSLTSYDGSANTFARISLGGFNAIGGGDMGAGTKGIGWRVQGGGSQALTLQVANGTTVTNVTSSFTPVTKQVFDWEIYSDGAGNVTLFVNDSQVATTTAGPTGTASSGLYQEGVDSTASSTAPFILNNLGTKIYYGI